jgi:uncharacterized iron-regulated protein
MSAWRPAVAAMLSAVAVAAGLAQAPIPASRIYATATARFVDVEALVGALTNADVVFIGEPVSPTGAAGVHRLELALLEGLAKRRAGVILVPEIFERDAAEPLEHFLMGHLEEAEFFKQTRPIPDYAATYKPLVDLAISRNWTVIAPSAPRPLLAEAARLGPDALKRQTTNPATVPGEVPCRTDDRDFQRFQARMTPQRGSAAPEAAFFAECLKDETTAESIAQAYAIGTMGGRPAVVVSVNAAVRSDFGDGVVARTRRRLPDKRIVVLTIEPVANLDNVTPPRDRPPRADYVLYAGIGLRN